MDCTAFNTVAEILEAFRTCSNAGEQIELFECLATRPDPPVDAFVQILDKIRLEPLLALTIQAFGQIADADIKERLKQSDDLLKLLSYQAESGASDLIRWAAATAIVDVGFDFLLVSQYCSKEPEKIASTIQASIWKRLEDANLTESEYEEFIKFKLIKAEDFYQRGKKMIAQKDYQRAIGEFNQALRINPKYADAYCALGAVYRILDENQIAVENLTQAIRLNSNHTLAYFNRGNIYSAIKEYPKAIEDLSQVLRIEPDNAAAYINRGGARYRLKDIQGAVEDYTQAIRLEPDNETAYFNRIVARQELEDYWEIIQDCCRLIKLNPNNAEYYYMRGCAYHERDTDSAIEDYTKAIQLNPDLVTAYTNRANARLRLRDYQGAILDIAEAANIYRKQGDAKRYHESQESVKKIQQLLLDSNDPHTYYMRGIGRQSIGNFLGAIEDLRKAAEFFRKQGNTVGYKNSVESIKEVLQLLLNYNYKTVIEVDESQLNTPVSSALGIDYRRLRNLLASGNWEAANQETSYIVYRIIDNQSSIERVNYFPCKDIRTIDRLWVKYSNAHFGFSVQNEIFQRTGRECITRKQQEKLAEIGVEELDDIDMMRINRECAKIFKKQVEWNRGEENIIYDLTAPLGHLPYVSLFDMYVGNFIARLNSCSREL